MKLKDPHSPNNKNKKYLSEYISEAFHTFKYLKILTLDSDLCKSKLVWIRSIDTEKNQEDWQDDAPFPLNVEYRTIR